QDNLGTRRLTGKLHAAKNVAVRDVPGHTCVEDVSYTEIHDYLGRPPGVDAAQNDCRRILSRSTGLLLFKEVARAPFPFAEALVAALHLRDDLLRRHLVALFFSQRISVYQVAKETFPNNAQANSGARYGEKCPAVQMTVFSRRALVGF